jgi:hypothetical protein
MSKLALQPTQIVAQMDTEDYSVQCTAASDWHFLLSSADMENGWNYASTYKETILRTLPLCRNHILQKP